MQKFTPILNFSKPIKTRKQSALLLRNSMWCLLWNQLYMHLILAQIWNYEVFVKIQNIHLIYELGLVALDLCKGFMWNSLLWSQDTITVKLIRFENSKLKHTPFSPHEAVGYWSTQWASPYVRAQGEPALMLACVYSRTCTYPVLMLLR